MLAHTDYIIRWIEKSRDEEDYFDKFVYGFFALNAMYSEFYDNSVKTGERGCIEKLFRVCLKDHRPEFNEIFDMQEYKYFCERRPIKNMRYNPNNPGKERADTRKEVYKLKEREIFDSNLAMLLILYQIRCNLFHGNKAYSNEFDQEVMKNASELLLKYNEIFSQCFDRF
ncbi:MAG: hypothetical protein K6G24_08345 [Lachnospiraceae bacterium]|nr:hypothetical protein [Lachnospiraceae bacterium]